MIARRPGLRSKRRSTFQCSVAIGLYWAALAVITLAPSRGQAAPPPQGAKKSLIIEVGGAPEAAVATTVPAAMPPTGRAKTLVIDVDPNAGFGQMLRATSLNPVPVTTPAARQVSTAPPVVPAPPTSSHRAHDGFGDSLWEQAIELNTRNRVYEVTGDIQQMVQQAEACKRILQLRDNLLAEGSGGRSLRDVLRGRVLRSWGTGKETFGAHTCWLVHASELVYPMAEFVKLVREGGPKTETLRAMAEDIVPHLEETMHEFDKDWGRSAGGENRCYLHPDGRALPDSHQGAAGRALFLLADITGKAEYRARAQLLAEYVRARLQISKLGDVYLWNFPNQPGLRAIDSPDDLPRTGITAHFMYVAWQHETTFRREDLLRLSRTFTRSLASGPAVIPAQSSPKLDQARAAGQFMWWSFLLRFDPQIDAVITGQFARPGATQPPPVVSNFRSALAQQALRLAESDKRQNAGKTN